MKRKIFPLFALLLLALSCGNDVVDYWARHGIGYDDVDAACDRFAVFAEKAVAAKEEDALAAMDNLFDLLKEDEVAYYLYTDWMDAAFYSPLSPCRSAAMYAKMNERLSSDGILSENDCAEYRLKLEWIRKNCEGSPAEAPDVCFDGQRTLVLVLDLGCPSCREALGALSSNPEWDGVRRIAVCCGFGPEPILPGWEYVYPEYPTDVFDPGLTPVYFVVAEDGTVESSYKPAV